MNLLAVFIGYNHLDARHTYVLDFIKLVLPMTN